MILTGLLKFVGEKKVWEILGVAFSFFPLHDSPLLPSHDVWQKRHKNVFHCISTEKTHSKTVFRIDRLAKADVEVKIYIHKVKINLAIVKYLNSSFQNSVTIMKSWRFPKLPDCCLLSVVTSHSAPFPPLKCCH